MDTKHSETFCQTFFLKGALRIFDCDEDCEGSFIMLAKPGQWVAETTTEDMGPGWGIRNAETFLHHSQVAVSRDQITETMGEVWVDTASIRIGGRRLVSIDTGKGDGSYSLKVLKDGEGRVVAALIDYRDHQ